MHFPALRSLPFVCVHTPPHTSAFCLSSTVPSRVTVCSSVGSVLMQGCRWRWRFDEVAASVLLCPFFSPCDVSAAQGTSPLLQHKSLWHDLGCRVFAFLLCWLWAAAHACVHSILSLFFPPQVILQIRRPGHRKLKHSLSVGFPILTLPLLPLCGIYIVFPLTLLCLFLFTMDTCETWLACSTLVTLFLFRSWKVAPGSSAAPLGAEVHLLTRERKINLSSEMLCKSPFFKVQTPELILGIIHRTMTDF